ncbi:hypothetical protein [Oceanobacillus sp. CFH 90083]|uniref:hypothetical protein n=1 Tax=Oceanobacillus sp. CFH 90083 TaxID=2592336 RepID=UPI001884763B|nr:hypothetical protein [Oceanobacillus sp. CFH 90083]
MTKRYNKECKLYTMKLGVEDERKVAEVARELDFKPQTQAETDSPYKTGIYYLPKIWMF